jgi:hypothetical protein
VIIEFIDYNSQYYSLDDPWRLTQNAQASGQDQIAMNHQLSSKER